MPGNQFVNTDQHRLPFFSDEPEKDRVSAEDWVARLLAAKAAGGWDDETTIGNARLVLVSHAANWYKALAYTKPEAYTNLLIFAKEFRNAFDNKEKPEDLNRLLMELKQKPEESVERFKNRCVVAMMKQEDKLPPLPPLPAEFQAADQGVRNLAETIQNTARRQVMDDNLFHYFLGGLRPRIREKVMDKRARTFPEAVEEALASETALNSGNGKIEKTLPVIAVSNEHQVAEIPQSAPFGMNRHREQFGNRNMRGSRRRGNFRGRGRGGNSPRSGNTRRILRKEQCAYCEKEGHWQGECRKRIRENGKLKKVHAVDEQYVEVRMEDLGAADPSVAAGSVQGHVSSVEQLSHEVHDALHLYEEAYGYGFPGNGEGM